MTPPPFRGCGGGIACRTVPSGEVKRLLMLLLAMCVYPSAQGIGTGERKEEGKKGESLVKK